MTRHTNTNDSERSESTDEASIKLSDTHMTCATTTDDQMHIRYACNECTQTVTKHSFISQDKSKATADYVSKCVTFDSQKSIHTNGLASKKYICSSLSKQLNQHC